jgi:hypothetical protein
LICFGVVKGRGGADGFRSYKPTRLGSSSLHSHQELNASGKVESIHTKYEGIFSIKVLNELIFLFHPFSLHARLG